MPDGEILGEPKFGNIPPVGTMGSHTNISRWASPLEKVRAHPGQYALVAICEKGHPEETKHRSENIRKNIQQYVTRHYPLDLWTISTRRIVGTWSTREVWVIFHGELTVQEMQEYKASVRAQWEKGRQNGLAKLAARRASDRLIQLAKAKSQREGPPRG